MEKAVQSHHEFLRNLHHALQILRNTLEQWGASCDDYSLLYDIEKKVPKLISATSKQWTIEEM